MMMMIIYENQRDYKSCKMKSDKKNNGKYVKFINPPLKCVTQIKLFCTN